MIMHSFETLYFKSGCETLTIVFPQNKAKEIEHALSRFSSTNNQTFGQLEKILLKCNGFIREL